MSAPNNTYDPVEVAVLSPEELERMQADALAAIAAASDLAQLKTARIAHFGDRAPLTLANAEIGALPPAARADAGKRVGTARAAIKQALSERQAELEADRDQRMLVEEAVDVTLPWDRHVAGARHPITTVGERLVDVFVNMGYEVAEGPEVEAEWYNFDALNFPPDHPAREMQDTIFVAGPNTGRVTPEAQTGCSGVRARAPTPRPAQIRAMLTQAACTGCYVVSPGKCYRSDALDATHSPVFHQIECLAVDEGLTMADLRGAITRVRGRHVRRGPADQARPDYFLISPSSSADVSMECHV